MKTNIIEDNSLFEGMGSTEISLIERTAHRKEISSGKFLAKTGDAANNFYLIESGRLAIEVPTAHGSVVVQTMTVNDVVGWSWLFEPHRWTFDVRAIETTVVWEFDGQKLRSLCDQDSRMGYELMKRFSRLLASRLEATRLRLLDIYGVKT